MNRGTEDSIVSVINALEDAHVNKKPLHLLSIDFSKAYDSPARLGGIQLGWRRMGVSKENAKYLTKYDEKNEIISKTAYYMLNKKQAKQMTFHAECGTAQGDSIAGQQWKIVIDIAVEFLKKHEKEIDIYEYTDPKK
jgi:hypothetical protein